MFAITLRHFSTAVLLAYPLLASAPCHADWELHRDAIRGDRPTPAGNEVHVRVTGETVPFPRYLNELGIRTIRIYFQDPASRLKRFSVVWSGGSQGPDQFEVYLDGAPMGASRRVDTERRPYMWYRDEFDVALKPGTHHVVELRSPLEVASAIEFGGFRMADPGAGVYLPLGYDSIGSLAQYEKALGAAGTAVETDHLCVFAPQTHAEQAQALSAALEQVYAVMKDVYGMDALFKFSVEHYPKGHSRGWGGISGAGTIGYTLDSLERFGHEGTARVEGFAGYAEEMSHGFKEYYKCGGTYEALGVAVLEEIVRRMVPADVADAYWEPEHRQWAETYQVYAGAGYRNPDPGRIPWNVFYTRILNHLFLRLRTEYGPSFWPDFFQTLREMDYPLHRADKVQRMGVYADVFSRMFRRDMRAELGTFGITLDTDPPWGWETYK